MLEILGWTIYLIIKNQNKYMNPQLIITLINDEDLKQSKS